MNAYIPEQGDLIYLDNATGDHKRRLAFVLSQKQFNEHTQIAIIAPITKTIRKIKLEVVLPDEVDTCGAILVYQLKSVDFIHRNATFVEAAPAELVKQVLMIAQLLVQPAPAKKH
jgi:mRNA-degrading endonuclease toxin of MazEF toxin-antitoxin module